MAAPDALDRLEPMHGRRSSGWWGALSGAVTLGAVLGYLLYAYFYLYVSSPAWPPEGIAAPALLRPAAAAAVLLASLWPLVAVSRGAGRADADGLRRGALGVAALGAVFLAAVAGELSHTQLDATEHAYAAIFFTLHGFHAAVTLAGVAMAVILAYQASRLTRAGWTWSAGAVLVVWWLYVVLGWLAVGAVAYGWPQVV